MRRSALRVVVIADMHGHLPVVPPCDLLILSGDIAPDFSSPPASPSNLFRQISWINGPFKDWLHTVQTDHVVATPGNHDFGLYRMRQMLDQSIRWHLLIDSGVELEGLTFWGSPWVGHLPGWAFNLDEQLLEQKWKRIPDDADVVVLHGPPYQIGDKAFRRKFPGFEHTGSPSLRARLDAIQPQLVTFGHIHEDRGEWNIGDTLYVNAAYLDVNYRVASQKPWSARLDLCTSPEVTSPTEEAACESVD